MVHSRKVWVKFYRRGLHTQTLLKKRDQYIRALIHFVSHTEVSSFQTNILAELDFLVKNCWYHKCRLLVSNLHIVVKDSPPRP